ncbi:hypothetical protein PR048_010605 [Dryococelus australis]|uniref:Uncharacterized protein n=1 Tax=Dryococelus australis TaxID=614101 RepID=A0ABQ9I371_9NEOP|nr:hypothetical protein PR048_010605 [Dryococelus australis]
MDSLPWDPEARGRVVHATASIQATVTNRPSLPEVITTTNFNIILRHGVTRANTLRVKCRMEPLALDVHNWLNETLRIQEDELVAVQMYGRQRCIVIKLTSMLHCERIMRLTAGTSQIRTSTEIEIDKPKTVRFINLPVEVKNENILHALLALQGGWFGEAISLPIRTSPGTSIVSQTSLREKVPNGTDHFMARPLHLTDADADDDMTGVNTRTHKVLKKKKKEEAQKRLAMGVRKSSPAIKAAAHDEMSSLLKAHNCNVHIHWRLLVK